MMRDCRFVLHGIDRLGELAQNDRDCATVPAAATAWGGLRGRYR